MWRYWAKALGEKSSPDDKEADIIALYRTIIVLLACIANLVLIANAIHHW